MPKWRGTTTALLSSLLWQVCCVTSRKICFPLFHNIWPLTFTMQKSSVCTLNLLSKNSREPVNLRTVGEVCLLSDTHSFPCYTTARYAQPQQKFHQTRGEHWSPWPADYFAPGKQPSRDSRRRAAGSTVPQHSGKTWYNGALRRCRRQKLAL